MGVPINHQQIPPSQPLPPPGIDINDPNIYETIDKRVRSNQRRQAELQRASTISTGTKYESIDRKNKSTLPARSNTMSADSQPTHNPYSVSEAKSFDQDVSDPYTIGKTLERQTKPQVTDIYADSLVNTTNQESLNLKNRESLNLEMFTPATDVINWQAPPDDLSDVQTNKKVSSSSSTGSKTTAFYAKKTASRNQPEDMTTLID